VFIRMIRVGVRWSVVDVFEYAVHTEAWMAPSLTRRVHKTGYSAISWGSESNRKGKCRELEYVLAVLSWQHPCMSTEHIIKIHYKKRRLEYQQYKTYGLGDSFLKSNTTALQFISNSLQFIGDGKRNCVYVWKGNAILLYELLCGKKK
jgi:hypothetical protein